MCERLGNYDISTETREPKIQWANALLIVHAGREPKDEMPPIRPDQIQPRRDNTRKRDIWQENSTKKRKQESKKQQIHGNM